MFVLLGYGRGPSASSGAILNAYSRAWRAVWYAVTLLGVGLGLLETPRGIVPVAFPAILGIAMLLRITPVLPRRSPHPVLIAFVGTGAFGYLALSRPLAVLF